LSQEILSTQDTKLHKEEITDSSMGRRGLFDLFWGTAHIITDRGTKMDQLNKRIDRAAASILENEALSSELDDAAAKRLLQWGVAWATSIAAETAGLDDSAAEEAMFPRQKALRRLLRTVNKWVAGRETLAAEEHAASLAKVVEQAGIIWREAFTAPDEAQQAAFLQAQANYLDDPPRLIEQLRHFLETFTDTTPANPEETDDP
jgi:hypothetical protein